MTQNPDIETSVEGADVMSKASPLVVTRLLNAWSEGDPEALNKLTPIVYEKLRCLARYYMMRERAGHTLQPTALVHEAYLKLIDWKNVQWQSRAQFFSVAARLMRNVLVDIARSHNSSKRKGIFLPVMPEEVGLDSRNLAEDMLAVHEALNRLEQLYPRACRVVELRYYAGLSVQETAEVLKISDETVRRDWLLANAWLKRELEENCHDTGTNRRHLSRSD